MKSQIVTWLVLPNGVAADASKLRLSIFVAPRLRTDEAQNLAPFVDLLDWPARINAEGTQISLELADGTLVPAQLERAPESQLWRRCFNGETPLRPFEFDDYADRPFVTFSALQILRVLKDLYARTVAASPRSLPSVLGQRRVEPHVGGLDDLLSELLPLFRGRLFEGVNTPAELDARTRQLLNAARERARAKRQGAARGGALIEPLPHDGTVAGHFARAYLFHRRPHDDVALPKGAEAEQHFRASVDFHEMLSALGDHPALLRRLGLVLDMTVDKQAIPLAEVAAPLKLRAKVLWASALAAGQASDRTPWTSTVHATRPEGTIFAAAPASPDSPLGLVSLKDTFALDQVDLDGAALKTLDLAATIKRSTEHAVAGGSQPFGQPDQAGLPALRTSGIGLFQAARAEALQADFSRALGHNGALESDAERVLNAEDLQRGFRFDVLDVAHGVWRSLHCRSISYLLDGAEVQPAHTDEGLFQVSLAAPATAPGTRPAPNAELYVHESLITWDGWSLSAPRPGKAVSRSPDATAPPERVRNEALTALGLEITATHAPGSLPRLRFGSSYRVRLRTVDLAGNGLSLEEADARMGPALADVVLPPPGETFVYRRFEPVPPPQLAPRVRYEEGASLLRLVIRSNAGQSAAAYAATFNASAIVTQEGHRPYSATDERHVAAPKASLLTVETHGRLDELVGSDGAPPDATRRAQIRAAYELARREKATLQKEDEQGDLHPEEQLELPYLPDPLAAGVVFFGLPGAPPDQPFMIKFGDLTWNSARPFRLALAEGSGTPQWDEVTRVLRVELPQATTSVVRAASLFAEDLQIMGVLEWCGSSLSADQFDVVYEAAKRGDNWFITPWQEITLVHAVQQPLNAPKIRELEVQRQRGSAFATLFGIATIHAPSTEKVDLVASWSEWDDTSRPEPERREAQAIAFDLAIRTAATGSVDADPRRIPYSLRDGRQLTFSGWVDDDDSTTGRHHFGDTKHRRVKYAIRAASPFREYFPAGWAQEQSNALSRTSEAVDLIIPASAPPPAPNLLYVVPTQGWDFREQDGASVRTRRGGGLRIYLDRGWHASGDGEQLGVVIGSAVTSPLEPDYPFVSLIGQDPAREAPVLRALRAESFRNPAAIASSPFLRLLELPEKLVTIAAFNPIFDRGTRRWFSDIDLDTEHAYFPIVRLALVRYQKHALAGCNISSVVVADIVQTLPDRVLTITPTGGSELQIVLTGPSYESVKDINGAVRSDSAIMPRVIVRVEQHAAGIDHDLVGWTTAEGAEVELQRSAEGGLTVWRGRIPSPAGALQKRIAVVEELRLPGDGTPGFEAASRIVYADFVAV